MIIFGRYEGQCKDFRFVQLLSLVIKIAMLNVYLFKPSSSTYFQACTFEILSSSNIRRNSGIYGTQSWKLPSAELLCFPPDNLNIDVLFIHSHGTNLGRQAQAIKDLKKCKWVQVVHSFHEECHTARYGNENELQRKMCEKADAVIAIGSKTAVCRTRVIWNSK